MNDWFDLSPFTNVGENHLYMEFDKFDFYKSEVFSLLKENGLSDDVELLDLLLEKEDESFEEVGSSLYTEGVNTDEMKSFLASRNQCIALLKEAKKLCSKKRFDEARAKAKEARNVLKKTQADAEKVMAANDTVGTAFMGNMLRFLQVFGKLLIVFLLSPGVAILAGYVTGIKEIITGLKNSWKKRNKDLEQSDSNYFHITIKNAYNKYYAALDAFEKYIGKSEDKYDAKMAKKREKLAKESVSMSDDDLFEYTFEQAEANAKDDYLPEDPELYMEGTNAKARDALKYLKKNVKPEIKLAKKAIKKGNTAEAKSHIQKARNELKVGHKMLEVTLKDDRISAVIIGNLLYSLLVFFEALLAILVTLPLAGAGGILVSMVESIRATEDDLSKFIHKSAIGKFQTADLNPYVNRIEGIFKRTDAALSQLEKSIGKPVKESAELTESSGSVSGQMLAQGGSTDGGSDMKKMVDSMDKTVGPSDPVEDDNEKEVAKDLKERGFTTEASKKLYDSIMEKEMEAFDRRMYYFNESVGDLLSSIKKKLDPSKLKSRLTEPNLLKATRLKAAIETDKVRMTVYTKKNPNFKNDPKYKRLQKSMVTNEKKLREIQKKLSDSERSSYESYCKDLKKKTDELLKKELQNIKEVQQYAAKEVIKAKKTIKESAEEKIDGLLFTEDFSFDYDFEEEELNLVREYPELVLPIYTESGNLDLRDAVKYMEQNLTPAIKGISKAVLRGDEKETNSLIAKAREELGIGHKKYELILKGNNITPHEIASTVSITSSYFKTLLNKIDKMPRFNIGNMAKAVLLSNLNSFDSSFQKLVKLSRKPDFSVKDLRPYMANVESCFKKTDGILKNMTSQVKGLCKIKTKSTTVTEAAMIDKAIADEIAMLNDKGYKTKYSSAGHNTLDKKGDRNDDGVYKGKLYTDARVQFDGKYDFPEAPKYWEFRSVDGDDYLDVPDITYNPKDGSTDEAFQKWKDAYLQSLGAWIDKLPNLSGTDSKEEEEKIKDSVEKESVDDFVDSFMSDLFVESMLD